MVDALQKQNFGYCSHFEKFLLEPSASPCNKTIQFKSTENSSASINHSVRTSEVIEL